MHLDLKLNVLATCMQHVCNTFATLLRHFCLTYFFSVAFVSLAGGLGGKTPQCYSQPLGQLSDSFEFFLT